jgi:hypothetical protein
MADGAAPRRGDTYLHFNGRDAYAEIPSLPAYSLPTTGALTVAAWMRPDVPNFPKVEGTRYVHWLGKGEGAGESGRQEWAFRIYDRDHTTEHPPRPNRISFYVFNPAGGRGVGSHVQRPVEPGAWLHLVGVADATRTYLYENGAFVGCFTYRGAAQGGCPIQHRERPHENQQVVVEPQAGGAPLRFGTRDFASYFEGGLTRIRLWSRALAAQEIADLFAADRAPGGGLVGQFLLDRDTGREVVDTARGNNGTITRASWARQT